MKEKPRVSQLLLQRLGDSGADHRGGGVQGGGRAAGGELRPGYAKFKASVGRGYMGRNKGGHCLGKSKAQRQVWVTAVDVEVSSALRWLKP